MAEMTWRDAIIKVLQGSNSAMSYTEITDSIIENRLRDSVGSTPARTVSATITTSINSGDTTFFKAGRGMFWLSEKVTAPQLTNYTQTENNQLQEDEPITTTGLINAFGMFWERDSVRWAAPPRLLGRQKQESLTVDFCKQIGVYLLYDGFRVVYVGRAINQGLGTRLFQHTTDRLQRRWNRFSWFGLFPTIDNSDNTRASINTHYQPDFDSSVLIQTLEALLIEGLEPPQNRKRGDDFNATEFLQVKDPRVEHEGLLAQLDALREKITGN
ncbi:HTH domain-containing protein [Acetobacter thailandicus]|uniref:HTH domain-containing protein n=1 Tax=Acetobacter thailandicus TaxID=1502842 RepID=UPI001BA5C810|nr:HTH domain-containing protein [Acetobacter thailandicus]MBS0980019.1 hypothetical protein [Acetobacter thailandicus]